MLLCYSLSLLPKQCAGFKLVAKHKLCNSQSLIYSSPFVESLIFIPFIKHFISLNRLTLHCALRCVLCSVFTVQLGALYGLHWCAVYACRVQWFLLRYHCKFLISVEDISSPNYFPPCRIFLHSHRLRFPSLSTNLKSHPKCQTECYLTLHYVQFQKNIKTKM